MLDDHISPGMESICESVFRLRSAHGCYPGKPAPNRGDKSGCRETDKLLIQLAREYRWTFLPVRSFELETDAREVFYVGPGLSK